MISGDHRLLMQEHFHILWHVNLNRFQSPNRRQHPGSTRKQCTFSRSVRAVLLCFLLILATPSALADSALESQRAEFSRAWADAGRGQRDALNQALADLQGYVLYPYLQYEDYRHRRDRVPAPEMNSFLESHSDWAFMPGLQTAWLKSLGKNRQWDALMQYAGRPKNTELRCYLAQARIEKAPDASLLAEAQSLWAVGQSQPDACDPVFDWLRREGGITPGLAWQRIRLAMDARQPRLTRYLARYLEADDRLWADRWYQQDRAGYRQLQQARSWEDTEKARDIIDYGLRRLARNDPDRAWDIFSSLDGHFSWPDDVHGGILHQLALWSAVDRAAATPERMKAVPPAYRDDQLLEWWARYSLLQQDWDNVAAAIGMMSDDLKYDSRWRYWQARAWLGSGDTQKAQGQFENLALEANFYGFLAADRLDLPYTICPQEPQVEEQAVQSLASEPGFARALELRRAGVPAWARGEWKLAVGGLDKQGLRTAAALAVEESWPDMAIFALGNSGDRRWYEWRFPMTYGALAESKAAERRLDPSWVLGLMRSESAMAEDALSSAGARGLMQVTPATARQLAKRHSFTYNGGEQLFRAEDNVSFGTAYLRDLMDRFDENPVLASGAYNAGPRAVDRWLEDTGVTEADIWIETLPYFETRDYIPRVLAFSTLYDWRMQRPVTRISSRMPIIDPSQGNGTISPVQPAGVVCRTSG